MADKKKDVTPKDIADWLKINPTKRQGRGGRARTDIRDAKKALGYEGPALKIRDGNLTDNRDKLRITLRGRSDYANAARRRNQEQTTPDPEVRAAANLKIKSLNQQGQVADHILTNSRIARGERHVYEVRGAKGVEEMRRRYNQTNPGYGHDPGNLQALTPLQNGAKEIQERILDKIYKHMAKKPNPLSRKFGSWEAKHTRLVNELSTNIVNASKSGQLKIGKMPGALAVAPELIEIINNSTGGAVDNAINSAVNSALEQVQKAGQSIQDFLVNQQPLGFDLDLTGFND